MKHLNKRNSIVVFLVTLFIGSLVLTQLPALDVALPHLSHASATSSDSASTGILQPLYEYPSTGAWAPVTNVHQKYPAVPYVVIVDINDGHFTNSDANYVSGIQDLKNNGITVIGYVFTQDCNRPLSAVESDINEYLKWYNSDGVSGIFFDQMAGPTVTSCSGGGGDSPVNYYQKLTSYAVQTEGFQFTIGNPGVDENSGFINTARTLNIFEKSSLPTNSQIAGSSLPSECQTEGNYGWHFCFDKDNFSFISHDQSSLPSLANIQDWSNYVGYMFISNASGSVYNHIPPYLDQEVADLNTPSTGITVNAENSSLNPIQGAPVLFYQPTASCSSYPETCGEIRQGATPITLNGSSGFQYEISAASTFGSCTFSKWADTGSTNPNRTVTLTSSATYTAIYTGGSCGSSSSPSITVDSENQTYGALPGYYTTLSYNGKVIQDGFTPVTFYNLVSGQKYTIDPEDYTCTFNHWNDTGSTVRLRTVTATSGNQKFIAVYTCPTSSSVTVQSVDQNDNKITGYYTVLYNSTGSIINTGYTPVTFPDLKYGAKYVVSPEDYGSCSFAYWKDTGNTTRNRSFVANGVDQTFTAVYNCYSSPSVTIQTINQNGAKITGYYVGLYNSGGTLINHGYSWVTFSGLSVGSKYSVEPDNYGTCTFNHWQDTGSTVRDRAFTAASTQTFTAVFDCT